MKPLRLTHGHREDDSDLPDNPYRARVNFSGFKCLLVHLTKTGDYSRSDYPLAYGYLAALIRMNGGQARVLLQDSNQYRPEDYAGSDLICFFPMSVLFKSLLEHCAQVKSDHPHTRVCLVNSDQHQHEMPLCSPRAMDFAREIMLQHPAVDFILVGEAEEAMVRLIEEIKSPQPQFQQVPSCLYREDGQVLLSTEKIKPVNFDYLPFPARDYLEDSRTAEGLNVQPVRIQSSRGCVSRCLYCVESSANITQGGRTKAWLGRDIDRFVDEIESLHRHYGMVFFNIVDSSFEDPGNRGLARIGRFCDLIRARGLEVSFKAHFRMESFSRLDTSFLDRLKQAGIDVLVIGAESSVDKELQSYKKFTTAKQNIEIVRRLDKDGRFFPLLGHMMFSPWLEVNDLRHKVRFLRQINRGWDYLNMSNNILAFRGTRYHDLIRAQGLDLDQDPLSPVVPYRYVHDQVRQVADEMGALKKRAPEVIKLQNLLYDALNIQARFSNQMNRHLWSMTEHFQCFQRELQTCLTQVQECYCGYFEKLLDLSEARWSKSEVDAIFQRGIAAPLPRLRQQAETLVYTFLNECTEAGLSTTTLHLKTWMSLINTESNTSGGAIKS